MSGQMNVASSATANAMGGRTTDVATGGDMLRQFAVIFATVLTLVLNWAANALPLNGLDTKTISDMYPALFTPAGFTFAIWGVIYFGLIAYTVYQALPSQRTNPRLRAIGWIYVASGVLNSLWIVLWHNLFVWWCVPVIVAMLLAVLLIVQRLYPTRFAVSRGEWWTSHLPFSIYLGWLSVATIANVSAALVDSGWSGAPLSAAVWTVVVLLVATALGLYFGMVRRDAAYVLVLVWAFGGIAAARAVDNSMLTWVAAGLSVALSVVAVWAIADGRKGAPAEVRRA